MPITGSCHCGKNAFRVDTDLPKEVVRCTCSFCAKRGALLAYCPPEQFHVTTPEDDDAVYRWNSKLVAHHFCRQCGCGTYSDSPAFETDGQWDGKTRRIGFNTRLLDGFDAAEVPVKVLDGKNLW